MKNRDLDLEQPLAIARDIKKLYDKLLDSNNNLTIDKFLIDNSNLRHVVRRAFIIEKFPYSEIQDNTISESIVPIDMLRLKLSFFGALKFDPRSDKWLRICMFQGAPLPNELKNYDEQWVYNLLNIIMKSLSEIETTSKRASRAAGFSWGVAEEIGKVIRLLRIIWFSRN